MKLFAGIVFVAAVATFGDYLWFAIGMRNQAAMGSAHGALLLGSVGLVLGWLRGRVAAGLLTGIAAGIGGALAYYALVAVGGRSVSLEAMLAAWAAVWIVLAICDARILRRGSQPWNEALVRGFVAAVIGGVAFYYMYGFVWGGRAASVEDYLAHFAAWVVAWSPGVLALTAYTNRSAPRDSRS